MRGFSEGLIGAFFLPYSLRIHLQRGAQISNIAAPQCCYKRCMLKLHARAALQRLYSACHRWHDAAEQSRDSVRLIRWRATSALATWRTPPSGATMLYRSPATPTSPPPSAATRTSSCTGCWRPPWSWREAGRTTSPRHCPPMSGVRQCSK